MSRRATSCKRTENTDTEVDMQEKEATSVEEIETILPVSYTHLDVYKRQECHSERLGNLL